MVNIGDIKVANDLPFVLFWRYERAGVTIQVRICEHWLQPLPRSWVFLFTCSLIKANRSSIQFYRGPGLEEAMKIFQNSSRHLACKVITDVHEASRAQPVADVVDAFSPGVFWRARPDLRWKRWRKPARD